MKAGFVLLLGLHVMLPITGHADTKWPTPEITRIEALDVPDTVTYVMRGEVGDSARFRVSNTRFNSRSEAATGVLNASDQS